MSNPHILLTWKQLAERWGSPEGPLSQKQVRGIRNRLEIPEIRLGHRCRRYRLSDVLEAEERETTTPDA